MFAALLPHVLFDGWTDAALRKAAGQVDLDFDLAQDLFPDALTMIDHHHRLTDAAMRVPETGGVTAKVRAAILSRLAYVAEDREAVRRALHLLALPHNLYAASKMSLRSADAIWRIVGSDDRGLDWVTKRTSLLGVYGATLLFWLSDKGSDQKALEAFLDQQLDRLLRVMKPMGRARAAVARAFSVS